MTLFKTIVNCETKRLRILQIVSHNRNHEHQLLIIQQNTSNGAEFFKKYNI